MKYIIKITNLLLILILGVSCSTDNHSEGNFTNKGIGYLVMEGMSVTVALDGSESKSKSNVTSAPDDFIVTISSDATGKVFFSDTYGALKAMTTPIELEAGEYNIAAKSPNEIVDLGWDTPAYYGSVNAIINMKETTFIDGLICKLVNVKTTVILDEKLKSLFKEDNGTDENLNVKLSLNDFSADFSRTETRAAFFKSQSEFNTIDILLTGMYNKAASDEPANYVAVNWKQKISKVKAGQWRKIYIKVENLNDGTVNFDVTIETWAYDEEINIDVMSQTYFKGEEEFIDPDNDRVDMGSAVLTLGNNHTFDNPFMINSDIFDFEGLCTDKISVSAKLSDNAIIEKYDIAVKTNNSKLKAKLKSSGYVNGVISIMPINSLSKYVVIGSTGNTLNVNNEGMKELYKYEGTHYFRLITVDSKKRRSYNELEVIVKRDDLPVIGPVITWVGGFDFDVTHKISKSTPPTPESFPVVIQIESETGITGFKVQINSEVLTDDILGIMNLTKDMDLVNPATVEMEQGLTGLGFPIKDDVAGQTVLSFDITEFMPLLAGLGVGKTSFVFVVTDAEGVQTKSIKLNVVQ